MTSDRDDQREERRDRDDEEIERVDVLANVDACSGKIGMPNQSHGAPQCAGAALAPNRHDHEPHQRHQRHRAAQPHRLIATNPYDPVAGS